MYFRCAIALKRDSIKKHMVDITCSAFNIGHIIVNPISPKYCNFKKCDWKDVFQALLSIEKLNYMLIISVFIGIFN